ncbi:hypothetical protein HY405_00705 [Candidatus Microgenomates bacterium]|nr:hypothetical protein [Candidatus Microgenomates bacterium]
MKFEGLPQFENQSPKERSPEYVKILAELERVIGTTEKEQREYIEKRLTALAENAGSGEMSHIGRGIHKGFLGLKMEVRRNMMVDPFVMDDPDLYADLFETIRKFKRAEGWKEKSLREIMPNAIQWTLSKYFGNIAAGSNTEMQNREFYLDHTSADSPSISIKELKGKGFAVCAEKGAAAQDLLAFVGMESELIVSSGCRIPAEAGEEAHYYILVHGPKGDIIYDPTNPRLLLDKDGKLTSYGPAMYPITEEQSQRLISGESMTIEHVDDKIDEGGQRIPDKSNRLYAGPRQRQ